MVGNYRPMSPDSGSGGICNPNPRFTYTIGTEAPRVSPNWSFCACPCGTARIGGRPANKPHKNRRFHSGESRFAILASPCPSRGCIHRQRLLPVFRLSFFRLLFGILGSATRLLRPFRRCSVMQPKSSVQVTRCASLDTNPCSAVLIPTTRTAARLSLCHACLRRRAKTLAWQSLSQTNEATSYNPRSLSVVAPALVSGAGLGFIRSFPLL